MPITYEPIATTTLTTATVTVTLSSIPSTYTDLRVVFVSPTIPATNVGVSMRLNNNSSAVYSRTRIRGNGSTASSFATTDETEFDMNQDANWTQPIFHTFDIFSYSGSTNKTMLHTQSTDSNGSGTTTSTVVLFRSTSAISSVTFYDIFGTRGLPVGTTVTLYGIKNA